MMDWSQIERALEEQLRNAPRHYCDSTVVEPLEPISLGAAINREIATEERQHYEEQYWEDVVEDAMESWAITQILKDANVEEAAVLGFGWDSLPASQAAICLVGTRVAGSTGYLCFTGIDNEPAHEIVAAVTPFNDPSAVSAAVVRLIRGEGVMPIIGGPPEEIVNGASDLISREQVRSAFFHLCQVLPFREDELSDPESPQGRSLAELFERWFDAACSE